MKWTNAENECMLEDGSCILVPHISINTHYRLHSFARRMYRPVNFRNLCVTHFVHIICAESQLENPRSAQSVSVFDQDFLAGRFWFYINFSQIVKIKGTLLLPLSLSNALSLLWLEVIFYKKIILQKCTTFLFSYIYMPFRFDFSLHMFRKESALTAPNSWKLCPHFSFLATPAKHYRNEEM